MRIAKHLDRGFVHATKLLGLLSGVALICSGCSLVAVQDYRTAQDNPAHFIGGHYEVQSGLKFAGASTAQVIEQMGADANGNEWKSYDPEFQNKYIKSGLVVNLNEGFNAENEKAKLMFQVTDYYKPAHGDTDFRIKVLNKKFTGTSWWINTTELCGTADKE